MFLNFCIKLGRWAEGKRDDAILDYVKKNPTASAGYVAHKFGLKDHQAVTGILRENGVKRPVAVAPPALVAPVAGESASGNVEVL